MKAALVSKSALQIARFYVLWFTIANVQAATQIKNSCSVSALKSIQPVLDFIKQADEQKNIGCVEELYPSLPSDLECAGTHLNADLIERCALKPQVAEEIKNPGHRVPFDHWMMMHVFIDRDKKIDLIYDAAKKYNMPPQFLYAVVNLEGSMTDLGVVKDGGNYSCGTGSVNIYQWCRWMNTLSKGEQTSIDWPIGISCEDDTLPPGIV